MAALPLALPRPAAAVTLFGLTTKELLMSFAGIAVIVSLIGVIWARESNSAEPPPPKARVARLATPQQLAALQLAMADGEASTPQHGRRVLLDYEPASGGGDIAGCLVPALHSVGIDWSLERMRGFLGQAFDFSMDPDGGPLEPMQQGMLHQWTWFFPMLDYFPVENINARLLGPYASPPGEHAAAKKRGNAAIRAGLDAGRPTIIWQAMTAEQFQEGKGPKAWLWSLAVGYDEDAGTVTVRNRMVDEVTIRFDELGHSDPSKNDYGVLVVTPPTEPIDWLAANRRVLERAIEASQGKAPGAQAEAHGLAAYEMWLAAFDQGTVSVPDVVRHATYLAEARSAAAVFLDEVEGDFPEAAQAHLREAADHYDDQVDALQDLRTLYGRGDVEATKGAALMRTVLKHERAALEELQRALDAS